MFKVKYFVFSCINFFLFFNAFGQHVSFIGDTANVLYEKSYDINPEIDSLTLITAKDGHSNWIVYFDANKKNIAYRSYLNGDSFIMYDYWRNGNIKEKNICLKSRNRNIYAVIYTEENCQNGTCISRIYSGDGQKHHYVIYYCNGNRKREYDGVNGRYDGEEFWYYPNGKIKSNASYKYVMEGNISHNYPIGEWKYYSEAGTLDSTQMYKNYKFIKTIK